MTPFQRIKTKGKSLYFHDNDFHECPPAGGATYSFHPALKDAVFAELLCEGSPERFVSINTYEEAKALLKVHLRVLKKAKVPLKTGNWQEFVPKNVFLNYLITKNEMTRRLIQQIPETESYCVLRRLGSLLHEISCRKVYEEQTIKYSMLKSKTGRLTTLKGSLPILTMRKESRIVVKPKNDFFLSLDFNAFDVRVLMALCGHEQPKNDPHQWHCENVFKIDDRNEAKRRYFAWLFNPNAVDPLLEQIYDRNTLLNRYYKDNIIETPYGKRIESDNFHALSYLVQSTAAFVFFESVLSVQEALKGRKSEIAILLHDEVFVDMKLEDKDMISQLKTTYSNTRFGLFPVRAKVGRNLGEMKKVSNER